MRLKPDKVLRNRWFVPDAMSHPAKGHLGLWWEVFERYTKPGQWVLDPMAGIGSSMIGAMMGRNVICNEMESHFIAPMVASWAKMRQQAMLGCEMGKVLIIQGDARCLPLGRADVVVTSPPWEDVQPFQDKQFVPPHDKSGFGAQSGYTRPAAVITSPPYEGHTEANDEQRTHAQFGAHRGYTRPAAVITSPPYEDSELPRQEHDLTRDDGVHERYRYAARGATNIGNLRGSKYWEAMRLVYAECHRVLAPGGAMVLVVKGYTRDGEYVDLPQQTVDECEALGFKLRERWARELWNLSFWRTLQGSEAKAVKVGLQMGLEEEDIREIFRTKRVSNGKMDERLRFEPVLVFDKF